MQPRYLTLSSSGSTSWQLTNWDGYAPMQIGFAITASALSSQAGIEITLADPSSTFSSSVVTVFGASQIGGPAASSISNIGSISTCPIAAWRLTQTSTGGACHVAALMQGIG